MSNLLIGLSQLFLGGVLLKYAVQNLLIASGVGEDSIVHGDLELEDQELFRRKHTKSDLIVEETEESQK